MTGINVRHGIGDLYRDLAEIPPRAAKDMHGTVKDGIRIGNDLAKSNAKRANAGPPGHARKYAGTFTAKMNKGFVGFGSRIIQGEYGPLARGQGELSSVLENGTRNGNKPQHNLARSADVIGPALEREVDDDVQDWFRLAGFHGG